MDPVFHSESHLRIFWTSGTESQRNMPNDINIKIQILQKLKGYVTITESDDIIKMLIFYTTLNKGYEGNFRP